MPVDLRDLYDKIDLMGMQYTTMSGVKVVDQDGNELNLVRDRISEDGKVILTFTKREEVKKLEENWEKKEQTAFIKNKE